jgi:Ricin-type beta-trefoil lectin domain
MRRYLDRVVGVPGGSGATLAVAALALTLVGMPGAHAQQAGSQQGVTGQITVASSGACLTAFPASGGKAQAAVVGRCTGAPAQRWTLAGDNTIRLRGECLAASGGKAAGAGIVLARCDGSAAQLWESNGIVQVPGDELVNVRSGKCLAYPGSSAAGGGQVRLTACTRAASQVWYIP